MIEQLLQLVQLETAGDPMGGPLWTRRSLSKLSAALKEYGIKACPTTVGKWLRSRNYSPRVNWKCLSRSAPAGRDEQFHKISALIEDGRAKGIGVISVGTKKKELIGQFANAGAVWCKTPTRVNDHDFRSQAKGPTESTTCRPIAAPSLSETPATPPHSP